MSKVAFIGNHLPRKCGIATFTADLVAGIRCQFPDTECMVLAMNDRPQGYAYPEPVRFEIADRDPVSYRRAADFLTINNVDVVCLQHEYGIYGGDRGNMILDLLRDIRIPVVTTLHTILSDPDPEQRRILCALAERSARLVTMSRKGMELLQGVYGIPEDKIAFIHHGIHDVPFVDPGYYKDQFDVESRRVLLTFGLLSPGKGLEHMIDALPAIVQTHPDVIYMVVGATHPHIKAESGESYRHALQRRAHALGMAEHLVFYDRFVELDELMAFIGAADLYVTPYLDAAQITSGALAYALGAGKAVVSTPYWHARELLADGRGCLVPFADPQALAKSISHLLSDDITRGVMRKKAYKFGRNMTWSRVADAYMDLFRQARIDAGDGSSCSTIRVGFGKDRLPEFTLDALISMTDDTGVLQHAVHTIPDRNHGYSIDDNARALILCTQLQHSEGPHRAIARRLSQRYLAYLYDAWNLRSGHFRNFLTYQRKWLEVSGSEDSHARSVWALGVVLGRSRDANQKQVAIRLFEPALESVREFSSPRAWAFAILGISTYVDQYAGDRRSWQLREELAERLYALYLRYRDDGWEWFEPILSYCNARLPQALLVAARRHERPDWYAAAMASMQWLCAQQRGPGGCFEPIGCLGWYPRGGERALFDQQPVEASNHVEACVDAWKITGEEHWRLEARRAMDWFLGANRIGQSLYDPRSGGCRDGLHQDRLNQNQGAESIIGFLLARLAMERLGQEPDTVALPSRGSAMVGV